MVHLFVEVISGIQSVWFKENLLGSGEYSGGEGVNFNQTWKKLKWEDYLQLSYLRLLTCYGCCRQKEGRYGWVFKNYLIETVIEWQVLLQLGKWTHPHEIKTPDDILSDPSSIPYTREVDEALKPHSNILQRLLTAPNSSHYKILSEVIPAKKWLQENNKDFSTSIIPHVGTLSIVEHAQVTNWFEKNIAWETNVQALWVGLLPIAHAHTLFIAY